MPTEKPHRTSARLLLLIGVFKLFKALLLLLVGTGALRLLHHDVAQQLSDWIIQIHVDPHNRYLHGTIAKLGLLDDHKLREIGFGSFFYASLLTLEGVGLCLRKRWAEYFTVGMTTSLVPLEIIELTHRITPLRVGLLLVNLIIVAYLVHILLHNRRAEAAEEALEKTSSPKGITHSGSPPQPASKLAPARPAEPNSHSSSHTVR